MLSAADARQAAPTKGFGSLRLPLRSQVLRQDQAGGWGQRATARLHLLRLMQQQRTERVQERSISMVLGYGWHGQLAIDSSANVQYITAEWHGSSEQ